MDITVGRDELLGELGLLRKVIDRKSIIPVLSSLKVDANKDAVTLTGTDLSLSLSVRVPGTVEVAGASLVPAEKLSQILAELPKGGVVRIATQEDKKDGFVSVTSGKSKFRLPGLPAEDFPSVQPPPKAGHIIPVDALIRAIKLTSFAVSDTEGRYYLNAGLAVLEEKSLTMVATDGHRLSCAKQVIDGPKKEQRILIPSKAIRALPQVTWPDAQVKIASTEDAVHIWTDTRDLSFKKLDGQFPDHEKVIAVKPGGVRVGSQTITLDVAALTGALRRVALVSEGTQAVRFTLADATLTLSSITQAGDASEEVASGLGYEGSLTSGLNAGYVLDFLSVVGTEKVEISLLTAEDSVHFRPADKSVECVYVVMPMRLL